MIFVDLIDSLMDGENNELIESSKFFN